MSGNTELNKRKLQKLEKLAQPIERHLSLVDIPESDELEIHKKATKTKPAQKVRFPKKYIDRLQMMPEEFENVQNAIEAFQAEERTVEVFADSMESRLGYDSLLRVMNKYFGSKVAFYRSEAGGKLSYEEARKEVYRKNLDDEEAKELLDKINRIPVERVSFSDLLSLTDHSPRTAQNVWEMIKREAQNEFESGHRASDVFEPADYMIDAWNRASYLALRESLCEEWQPRGGIELSMIDAIAQAWLQIQFWTKESVKRAKTEPRQENEQFEEWKKWNNKSKSRQWEEGYWDIPMVSEQQAIEQAAQMADRWQRMYFRAIRSLRDWRRYTPQVTINNPQQVNIAADGGQQINVAKTDEEKTKQITS